MENGIIDLRVIDESGQALPGVNISISGPERRKGVTNVEGLARFPEVRLGEYEVTASLEGFKPDTQKARVELPERAAYLRFQLKVAE